jgi:pyrimidine operon attenuation protein/uracil phosphoribosyltransferase
MGKRTILKENDISKCIQDIAKAILEQNDSMDNVVLVGIRTGGAFLAERLQKEISRFIGDKPHLGILDITLYRDDWTRIGPTPVVKKTDIPCSVNDRNVILVDDVLFTGRTVRAAMDALIDYGRPKKIKLAVLVDRGAGFRELPIMADFRGGIWEATPEETVNVYLTEEGFPDHVAIEEKVQAVQMKQKEAS